MTKGKMVMAAVSIAVVAVFGVGRLFSGPAASEVVLNIYGPGGPQAPVQECADIFAKDNNIKIKVSGGSDDKWIESAKKDADIIFGAAEHQLYEFVQEFPGLVDVKTRTTLYVQPGGILVRKGNSKKITSVTDLAKDGIRIMDVTGAGQTALWEDIAGLNGVIPQIQRNIVVSVKTTGAAIEQWRTVPELDAWIAFESWSYRIKDTFEVVKLPEASRIYRGTPIALTTISKNREMAQKFLEFLKTEPAHAIFQKYGWK
ncbi:MAG: substrate-binding domain-containing protein [Candidatus Brocadiia bacterium]